MAAQVERHLGCSTFLAMYVVLSVAHAERCFEQIDSSLLDFPLSLSRAAALDTKIVSDTQKLGLPTPVAANLTNLVIMSVRQTIGSLEITTNRTGPVRLDDLRVFMKDIGNS